MEKNKSSWRPFSHLSNGCLDWKNPLVSVCPKTSASLRCWLRPSSQQGQHVPLNGCVSAGLVRSWRKRDGDMEAVGGPVAGPRDKPQSQMYARVSQGSSVPHKEPRSGCGTVTKRACLACSTKPWWFLPAGNRPQGRARGLTTWTLLPRADVTRPWQGPLRTGHLTCVCFDFVVPAWKPEPPVREINKMDMTLILQCYYQQGESTSVQLPSRP